MGGWGAKIVYWGAQRAASRQIPVPYLATIIWDAGNFPEGLSPSGSYLACILLAESVDNLRFIVSCPLHLACEKMGANLEARRNSGGQGCPNPRKNAIVPSAIRQQGS